MEIRLEPLGEQHLDALETLTRDPDVLRFTRIPVPTPDDFVRTWLAGYERGRADGTREAFAIVDGDGAFLGLELAPEIHREARELEIGYIVAPEARGRGVAIEGLRLMTAWAFEEAAASRIVLYISAENGASRRVAERCGYVLEGILRSLWIKPGVREDTEVWSRLATDP